MDGTSRWGERRRLRAPGGTAGRFRWAVALLVIVAATPVALRAPVGALGAQGGIEPPATAALAPEDAVLFFAADLDLDSPQWRQARTLLGRAGVPNAVEDLERTVLAELDVETTDRAVDLGPFYGREVGLVVTAAAFDEARF